MRIKNNIVFIVALFSMNVWSAQQQIAVLNYGIWPYMIDNGLLYTMHWDDFSDAYRSLSCVNKYLQGYCSHENTRKRIVNKVVEWNKQNNNTISVRRVADEMCFRTMQKKIDDLFRVAQNQVQWFKKDDLKDQFYVNATSGRRTFWVDATSSIKHKKCCHATTLLDKVCETGDIKKVKQLLFSGKVQQSTIYFLASHYICRSLSFSYKTHTKEIIKILIDHMEDVDWKESSFNKTLLMCAVAEKDLEMARYLLKKGASGYLCALRVDDVGNVYFWA